MDFKNRTAAFRGVRVRLRLAKYNLTQVASILINGEHFRRAKNRDYSNIAKNTTVAEVRLCVYVKLKLTLSGIDFTIYYQQETCPARSWQYVYIPHATITF